MKNYFALFFFVIYFLIPNVAFSQEYEIHEAEQSLSGYYKQKIEYEKWKDHEIQKSQSDYDSAKAYQQGIIDYQKALQRQADMKQFSSSLNNALLGVSSQMQQIQELQKQQSSGTPSNYQTNNYSSPTFYNTTQKSNNGYPVLDPYTTRFMNNLQE